MIKELWFPRFNKLGIWKFLPIVRILMKHYKTEQYKMSPLALLGMQSALAMLVILLSCKICRQWIDTKKYSSKMGDQRGLDENY